MDAYRLGGIGWLEQTNGALTSAERRKLMAAILKGSADVVATRFALLTGRTPINAVSEIPKPPDSAIAREAEEEAAEQPAAVLGHAYRSWAFGRALAAFDQEHGLDEELFYIVCLLHDVGLTEPVRGEDFTLRSAAAAAPVVGPRGTEAVEIVRDAIACHCTPGATVEVDGPTGFYLQAGATCDLAGVRLHQLAQPLVETIVTEHPRDGLKKGITALISAEARAVPEGRFNLLARTGFNLAIRLGPLAG